MNSFLQIKLNRKILGHSSFLRFIIIIQYRRAGEEKNFESEVNKERDFWFLISEVLHSTIS